MKAAGKITLGAMRKNLGGESISVKVLVTAAHEKILIQTSLQKGRARGALFKGIVFQGL